MDAEYWLQRWRDGRTGWHQDSVMPLLEKHWPAIGIPRGATVLVPLCGKSLDMLWLASQGLHVLGVELSPLAIKAFLEDNHLGARQEPIPGGTLHHVSKAAGDGSIRIINGDIFQVAASTLRECDAVYDRAATIALPAPLRRRFAKEVYAKLSARTRGLLIVLDYPPHEKDGPPFPVDDTEVHGLFEPQWSVRELERRDILASQPGFQQDGVSSLHTAVYQLTRS